uniref:Deoxyribonuclease-2-alpha n=1 Tax=Amphilophus citrinellus TaxID=61819 RepID=A0A3Q0T826_AMPCI
DSIKGVECLYIDSQGMRRAGKDINDPQGVLANTLKDLFSPKQNIGFISYSDQPPNVPSVSQNFGHSKGVLLVDKSGTGIWLLHSTPKFPKARDANSFWPESGQRNAQTFICVTFPYDQFKHIAFPFDHDITADFHRELQDVVNEVLVDPDDHFQELTSSNGFKFYSIAKKENDIYIRFWFFLSNFICNRM